MDCPTETQDQTELELVLDPEIRGVVMMLRAAGLKTFSSCSGNPGHCFDYPAVRIEAEDLPAARALTLEVLKAQGYDGYYVKEYYSSQEGISFLEVEFWGLDCLIPAAEWHDEPAEPQSFAEGTYSVSFSYLRAACLHIPKHTMNESCE